ncbi:Rieske 2Fe-2S domain-containing protein [Kribbella karoonensis]|uniref:Rieske 2Fe-2S domain-containing protein n=1 Tax=Kribbella karoonensis TaxID=324851 RepID=UPI0031DDBCC3
MANQTAIVARSACGDASGGFVGTGSQVTSDREDTVVNLRETAKRVVGAIGEVKGLDRISQPVADLVRRATGPELVKYALSGTWLGHPVHPMLTDVPIGAWVMASTLDWTAGDKAQETARHLVGLGLLTAVPTAAAGASDWSDTVGSDQRVGVVHGLANLTATCLQVMSWTARRRGHHAAGRALSAAGLGITMGSSYLGGYLSYTRGIGVNRTAFEATVTEWVDVAELSDLSADKPIRVSAGGVPVVLVRREGSVDALSATCVHAGGPLDEGELVDGCIRCPWHASTFRLTDGQVVRGPATVDQPSWQVKIDQGRVFVRSSSADPTP